MSAVLEAKDAIRELMAAYAQALDACRFADVAACFAPDGEWATDYGAARGPAEIEAFIRRIVPVKGEGPQRKHYITNIIIAVDGDTASAVSDYLVVREAGAGLIPVMGGTYRDKFVRTPAGWRFARKELEHHIAGDMALKNGR
jgi:ketosteroid isomerase-like protein